MSVDQSPGPGTAAARAEGPACSHVWCDGSVSWAYRSLLLRQLMRSCSGEVRCDWDLVAVSTEPNRTTQTRGGGSWWVHTHRSEFCGGGWVRRGVVVAWCFEAQCTHPMRSLLPCSSVSVSADMPIWCIALRLQACAELACARQKAVAVDVVH